MKNIYLLIKEKMDKREKNKQDFLLNEIFFVYKDSPLENTYEKIFNDFYCFVKDLTNKKRVSFKIEGKDTDVDKEDIFEDFKNNRFEYDTVMYIIISTLSTISKNMSLYLNSDKAYKDFNNKNEEINNIIKQILITIEVFNHGDILNQETFPEIKSRVLEELKSDIKDLNCKEKILTNLKSGIDKLNCKDFVKGIIEEQYSLEYLGLETMIDLLRYGIIDKESFTKYKTTDYEGVYNKLYKTGIISKDIFSRCIDCENLINSYKNNKNNKFKNKYIDALSNSAIVELILNNQLDLEDLVSLKIKLKSLLDSGLPFEKIIQYYESIKPSNYRVNGILLKQVEILQSFLDGKISLKNVLKIKDFIAFDTLAQILNAHNTTEGKEEGKRIFSPQKVKELYDKDMLTTNISLFCRENKSEKWERKLYELFKQEQDFKRDKLISLYKQGLISLTILQEEFNIKELYEKNLITVEELGRLYEEEKIDGIDFLLYINEEDDEIIKLWDKGIISSEKLIDLEIRDLTQKVIMASLNEDFVGKNLSSLAKTSNESESLKKEILELFNYGVFDNSIKPIAIAYESGIIPSEIIKKLMRDKTILEEDILEVARKGIVTGKRIAQLRFCKENFISKEKYNELKINYPELITGEDEDYAINNMTAQEQLEELESNGWIGIKKSKIEEILQINGGNNTKREKKNAIVECKKSVISPYKRYELLKCLNIDEILITPKDRFKGYQALLIPTLGIAVLERFFREKKNGETEAVYGEATYVCKISDCISVASKSKTEIIKFMDGEESCAVDRIYHSKYWAERLCESIQKVNPNVKIKRNADGEIEQILVNEKEVMDSNKVKDLNLIISKIKNGEYSKIIEQK